MSDSAVKADAAKAKEKPKAAPSGPTITRRTLFFMSLPVWSTFGAVEAAAISGLFVNLAGFDLWYSVLLAIVCTYFPPLSQAAAAYGAVVYWGLSWTQAVVLLVVFFIPAALSQYLIYGRIGLFAPIQALINPNQVREPKQKVVARVQDFEGGLEENIPERGKRPTRPRPVTSSS